MSNNSICIFCRTLPQITTRRRRVVVPSTIRGYKNYNLRHEKITKPQLHFPLLKRRKDEKGGDIEEQEHPSGLPMSPIMDKEEWDNRYKQPSKAPAAELKKLSPVQKELLRNPYARALASPIRADFYLRLRIPRSFLIPLSTVLNPNTSEPWILPCDIKSPSSENKKPEPKPRQYGLATKHYFDFVSESSRRWGKVRVEGKGIPRSAVWRQDMGTFVLAQMRRRVVDELVSVRRCIVSANKENGKWKKPSVGCVLLWSNKENELSDAGLEEASGLIPEASAESATVETEMGSRKEVVVDAAAQSNDSASTELEEASSTTEGDSSNPDITQPTNQQPITITNDDVSVNTEPSAVTKANNSSKKPSNDSEDDASEVPELSPARGYMLVGDKTVPTYDMEILLGSELASELRTALKLEQTVMRNAIMTSDRSIAAQMWLLKLSGYLSR